MYFDEMSNGGVSWEQREPASNRFSESKLLSPEGMKNLSLILNGSDFQSISIHPNLIPHTDPETDETLIIKIGLPRRVLITRDPELGKLTIEDTHFANAPDGSTGRAPELVSTYALNLHKNESYHANSGGYCMRNNGHENGARELCQEELKREKVEEVLRACLPFLKAHEASQNGRIAG